jgi:hypothetical protein
MKAGNEKAILWERFFEDALTREGVDLHYLPLVRGGNNELKEKGIDVSLALDAYKKTAAKAIDILVLIAGDGDYLPLVRELQTMVNAPVDVMLLSWDFECTNGDVTMTSQDLLEEVKYPIQMANVIDDRLNVKNPVVSGLFEPRQFESPGPQAGIQANYAPPQTGVQTAPVPPPFNPPPPGASSFGPPPPFNPPIRHYVRCMYSTQYIAIRRIVCYHTFWQAMSSEMVSNLRNASVGLVFIFFNNPILT